MSQKKVFVSFDFDKDRELKNSIVGQSQKDDAPFKISGWSSKADEKNNKWIKEAKYRISKCDVLVVMVGENTHQSAGVNKEVEIARDANMQVFQLNGAREEACAPVEGAGKLHDWTWDNVVKLLS